MESKSSESARLNTIKVNGYSYRGSIATVFFSPLFKNVTSSMKEFAPLGANSFLEE